MARRRAHAVPDVDLAALARTVRDPQYLPHEEWAVIAALDAFARVHFGLAVPG